MKSTIVQSLRMLFVLTILTGVVYPLAVTVIAQAAFPAQAGGSLVTVNGTVVGSSLIAQNVEDPRYFSSRPSAVDTMLGSNPDALGSSGASNAGPTSASLASAVAEREAKIRADNGLAPDAVIPQDLLFASGSGLDPHISPEAARLQIDRVAVARGIAPATLAALVDSYVEPPQFGLLGQPRVNVLMLNLAVDALQ